MAVKKATKKGIKAKVSVKSEKASVKALVAVDKLSGRINQFRSKRYFVVVIAVLVLATLAYLGRGLLVAATVGGHPITRLTLVRELERKGGKDALESLITKELIAQSANKKGVSVTPAEVSAEMQRISGIVEKQGGTLDAALEAQGQTRSDLEENIRIQKTVEKLLADKIQVSDEEVLLYYEKNKDVYGKDAKYDDIKAGIKEQLIQDKLTSEFETYLASLRAENKIIYFTNL